jgi:hypothetical protein
MFIACERPDSLKCCPPAAAQVFTLLLLPPCNPLIVLLHWVLLLLFPATASAALPHLATQPEVKLSCYWFRSA